MFYLSVFFRFLKIRWKAGLEYPAAFALGILGQFISYGFEFLTLWIMVSAFDSMLGWTAMEVLFLFAMNLLAYGIGASFGYNVCTQLPSMARSGAFDDILIKPIHSLLYMVSANFNIGYVTHIGLSTAMLVLSLTKLGIAWSLGRTMELLAAVFGAALIHFGLMLITAIPSLRILGESKWGFLYWQLRDVANYPLSVFDRPIQLLFTFVLPFGFIGFFPAQAFLHKSDLLHFPLFFVYLTPAIGLGLLAAAIALWRAAVNRYESTGS